MPSSQSLDGASLTLPLVARIARGELAVELAPEARARMERSAAWVAQAASGELKGPDGRPMLVYGVNTGYGSLARVRIADDQIRALSWNLIRSHAAGVGPPVPEEQVRAMMLLRANALAKGASGCRPLLVDTLCRMLERGVVPEVPSRGSCGSSGDLAPLAHLGLVVFEGEGEDLSVATFAGQRMAGGVAMARAGIGRLVPGPKEGLAMTNGAQLTAAIGALTCHDAESLVHAAVIAAALSFEALWATTRALHPAVHALRPFPGAIATAGDLRRLLEGSELVDSVPDKVQDAYSLRCTPQVLGAVRDAVTYAGRQVSIEINAATDNPVVLVDEPEPNKAFSAGLFHGEPVGFAVDHLKLALCELGALSERRTYRLTTGDLSSRLPPLLVDGPGLGLMMPQVAAAAAVATARQLAFPNAADTIPTCEDQEDHVAMSTSAARRAHDVLQLVEQVVAIELLAATRAIRMRTRGVAKRLGAGTGPAFTRLDGTIAGELPADDIARVVELVRDGSLVRDVERAVGPLTRVHDHV
ncbi:MAG: aromatic amino acid lyase [Myxococcota bacterium]